MPVTMTESQVVSIVLNELQKRREAWAEKRALNWRLTPPRSETRSM